MFSFDPFDYIDDDNLQNLDDAALQELGVSSVDRALGLQQKPIIIDARSFADRTSGAALGVNLRRDLNEDINELCEAASNGDLNKIQELLDDPTLDLYINKLPEDRSALSYALEHKQFAAVKLLIKKGANPLDLDKQNFIDHDALLAFLRENSEAYHLLLIAYTVNENWDKLTSLLSENIPVDLNFYSQELRSRYCGQTLAWALLAKNQHALFETLYQKYPKALNLDLVPQAVVPVREAPQIMVDYYVHAEESNLLDETYYSIPVLLSLQKKQALLMQLAEDAKFKMDLEKKYCINFSDNNPARPEEKQEISLSLTLAYTNNFAVLKKAAAANPNVIIDTAETINIQKGKHIFLYSYLGICLGQKEFDFLQSILLNPKTKLDINKLAQEGSFVARIVEIAIETENETEAKAIIDFLYKIIDATQQQPILCLQFDPTATLVQSFANSTIEAQAVQKYLCPALLLATHKQFTILDNLLKRCNYRVNINVTAEDRIFSTSLASYLATENQWDLFDKILTANPTTTLNLKNKNEKGKSLEKLLLDAGKLALLEEHKQRLLAIEEKQAREKEALAQKRREEFLNANPHLKPVKSEENPEEKDLSDEEKKKLPLKKAFNKILANKKITAEVIPAKKEGLFSIELTGPEESMVTLGRIITGYTSLKKNGPNHLPREMVNNVNINAGKSKITITEAKESLILDAVEKNGKVITAIANLKNYNDTKADTAAKPPEKPVDKVKPKTEDNTAKVTPAEIKKDAPDKTMKKETITSATTKPKWFNSKYIKPVGEKSLSNQESEPKNFGKPTKKEASKKQKNLQTPPLEVQMTAKPKKTFNKDLKTSSIMELEKEYNCTEKNEPAKPSNLEEKKISKKLTLARKNTMAYHLQKLTDIAAPDKSPKEEHAVMFYAFLFNTFRILALLEDSCKDKKNKSKYEITFTSWRNVIRHAYANLEWEDFYARMTPFLTCLQKAVGSLKQTNLLGGELHFKSVMTELENALAPFQNDIANKTLGGSKAEKLGIKKPYEMQLEEFQIHAGRDVKNNYRDASLMLASILADENPQSIFSPIYIPLGHEGFDDLPELFLDEIYTRFLSLFNKNQNEIRL